MKSKEFTLRSPYTSPLIDALTLAGYYSDEGDKAIISYRKIANKMVREGFTIRSKRDLQVCINALHFGIVYFHQYKYRFISHRISRYKSTIETLILVKNVVF